jgi:Zn-finger nucleic acid-binding protein
VRLLACSTCHTQYDVTHVIAAAFPCRCGARLENRPPKAVDAPVCRCGACGALAREAESSCEYCGAALAIDPGRLSLICPECFARTAEDARFCTACGTPFRPEPVLVEGRELPCPACTLLMPPRQFLGLALNECPRCNGLWVPDEHLDELVRAAIDAGRSAGSGARAVLAPRVRGSNPAAQRVEYRRCPECDVQMLRRNFRRSSGVIVDECREHGTWLDADELEQIAGFFLSGGEASPLLDAPAASTPAERRARVDFARILAQSRAGAGVDGASTGSLLDVLTRLFS